MREVIKYFENRDYLSFDVIYEITRILYKYFSFNEIEWRKQLKQQKRMPK